MDKLEIARPKKTFIHQQCARNENLPSTPVIMKSYPVQLEISGPTALWARPARTK